MRSKRKDGQGRDTRVRVLVGLVLGMAIAEVVLIAIIIGQYRDAAASIVGQHRDAAAANEHRSDPRRSTRTITGGAVCSPEQVAAGNAQLEQRQTLVSEYKKSSRILETSPNGLELWETPRGQYWIPPGDSKSLLHVLAEQANGIYWTQEAGVQSGDIVLDVGASFGAFTREALQRGASKVIAIDPAPVVVECLRRNLAAEIAAGKVIVVDKGAWDKDDTLVLAQDPRFTVGGHILTGVHAKSGSTEVEVPLTTIDKMVAELSLKRVDFIKLDIEGAEERAIPGIRATIARDRPRMAICVYHQPNHAVLLSNLVRTVVKDYRSATVCSRPNALPEVTFFW